MINLQALNYRHRALLTWCLANPHRKLGDSAYELNYTRPYLSAVFHSDAFQAAYMQACQEQGVEATHFGTSIREKLNGLAHSSLDEIQRRLEANVLESKELLSAGKLSLTALGYINPKGYSVEQQVTANIQVDITVINEARERALQGNRQAIGPTIPAQIEAV